jgi:N-acetylneuraminate synthase
MIIINDKKIVNFGKPYVIAEIGANHNGDMEIAKKMIDSAVECGADAVKFQSWTKNSLVSESEYRNNQTYDDSPKKHFGSLREMVEKYYLREEEHRVLNDYCHSKGIVFCSTPFSTAEVDLLEELDVPFYKIASLDINNYQLLTYVASKQKPILLSTGMSTISEIEKAIKVINETGNKQVVILHCISIYPPKPDDIHLNNISMLREVFPNCVIGFSDHTLGTSVPIASIALGAAVVEKHFTIDKEMPGWDHEISADPQELKYIVSEGEVISKALGNYHRTVSEAEEAKKGKFRRSIVASRTLKKGHIITEADIAYKRPGTHISPDKSQYVIGRVLNRDVSYDDLLDWKDFV